MSRLFLLTWFVLLVSGCGATVPKRIETFPESSEPAAVAVLPFQNLTGDTSLNWLRSALSATLSIRLRDQHGLTTVDGTMIRRTFAEQHLSPSGALDEKTAISLSGVLYAQTLITGTFKRTGKQLIVTATQVSGETGQPIKSATVTGQDNEQSALVDQLILGLIDRGTPDPLIMKADSSVVSYPRDVLPAERMARMPVPVTLSTPEQIEEAVLLYRRALETNPNLADAHFALGYAYDKQGESEKALSSYRQAVTLNPLNADYLYSLGYAYERKKDLDAALESYRRAFTIKPDDSDIAFAIGYVYEQQGHLSEAMDAYRRAIDLKPDDPDAHYGLAIVSEASGHLNEALSEYRRVIQLKPDQTYALSALAVLSARLEQWDETIIAYQAIIKMQPDSLAAHQTLANAYRKKGRVDDAIAEYREIIRLQPQSSTAYTSLGNLYVQKGLYDQAVEQYRAGLKVSPNAPTLLYNLGNVYAAQKKYRDAITEYTLYLKVAPDGEYAKELRDRLSDLQFKATSEE